MKLERKVGGRDCARACHEEMRTSFRIMKMTRTVFENKVAISTQKTVCNKMSNSIQTDKVYLHAMLEVIMDE